MEERFDKMHCPNCGGEMEKGVTIQAYDHPLVWSAGRNAITYTEALKLSWSKKKPHGLRRFTSRFRTRPSYFPAWYCESCELMTVDTKTEMEEA